MSPKCSQKWSLNASPNVPKVDPKMVPKRAPNGLPDELTNDPPNAEGQALLYLSEATMCCEIIKICSFHNTLWTQSGSPGPAPGLPDRGQGTVKLSKFDHSPVYCGLGQAAQGLARGCLTKSKQDPCQIWTRSCLDLEQI